jgi:hypothetical protein
VTGSLKCSPVRLDFQATILSNEEESVNRFIWRFVPSLAVLAFGLITVSGARAQCAVTQPQVRSAVWRVPYGQGHLSLIAAKQDARQDGRQDEDDSRRSIVGLWHLNYTATFDENFPPPNPFTPPFPFLESYKMWHADGTEWENAFMAPSGGNICFGVWKDLGHGSVKLHHIGLMFGEDGKVSNVFTVDETDTVAEDGKTYTGFFDFKLFDATDVFGTGTPIAEVKGTTKATRITVD